MKIMQTPEQRKAWLAKNPGRMARYNKEYRARKGYGAAELNRHLKRKYGISVEDKQRLWDAQKGICPVCKNPLPGVLAKDCQVDHCHKSNTVRGLLHWYCNSIVGIYENYPTRLENIARYLDDAIVRTHGNDNHERSAEMTDPTPLGV